MTVAGGSQASGATRGHVYAVCILALVANAVVKTVVATAGQGLAAALPQGLGLSWAFWLSVGLCVRLALMAEPARPTRLDWLAVAGCLLASAMPIGPISSAAATALSLWLILDRSSDIRLKAAAMVLLAITVNLLWGRLVMAFFAAEIAALDAHLVGLIAQTQVHDNMVRLLDGHRMTIVEGCTSVENASVALMMFVAIVRTFRPSPRLSEMFYLGGVFAFVIAVNETRLSLMARSMDMFELVHGPTSWAVLNLIFTLAGLTGAALCVRREILT